MIGFSKKELKIFLTVFIVSFIFIHWLDWNGTSRLDLTRAILEEGRLEIDSYANNTGDRAYINGHYYTEKSPSNSFLIVPFYGSLKFINYNFFSETLTQNLLSDYSITKWNKANIFEPIYLDSFTLFSYIMITISTSVLFTSLTTVLIYKISKFFLKVEWQRLFVSFGYWLCTLAFFYSLIFYNHPFPTFLAFLSFYILFRMKHSEKKRLPIFMAGIFLGLAIFSEYPAILFLIPFLMYVLHLTNKSRTLMFLVAVIIGVSPLLIYDYLIMGNPLVPTYGYWDPLVWEGSGLTENFGLNFSQSPYVFLRLLAYPERGLFFYFPFLIFSIFGFYFMLKEYKPESFMILSMFILILALFSAYKSWWEYSSFGPRRIFLITPFLMLPVIYSLKKIKFIFILLLFLVSLFINIISLNQDLPTFHDVFVLSNSFKINPEVIRKVSSLEIIDYVLPKHHLPYFFEIGPRSRLIESFFVKDRVFDIRDIWPQTNFMEDSRILNLRLFTLNPFGFAFMKISFITTLVVIIIIFLIWRKTFIDLILRYKYLFGILFLLILLNFFRITDIAYGKNWFAYEVFNGDSYRWMSNNGTLVIYSPKDEKAKLQFTIQTFYRNRSMEMYLNDKLIKNYEFIGNETSGILTPLLDLKAGENVIRFETDGCDVPAEVGAWENDRRCLSFNFFNLKRIDINEFNKKLIFENWFAEEKDKSSNFRWMSNESNINYYVSDVTTINLTFSTRSYHEDKSLDIYANDKFIKRVIVNVSWNNEKITLNLNRGDNVISFNSVSGCDVPKEIEGTNDNRCLSFAFKDIKIE
jgi:hypothetical protein